MRPSPPPLISDFPSSPSAWSCADSCSPSSATQGHLSPATPDSLVDEFTLQIDAPHKPPITHILPQPSVSSDLSFLSEDDATNLQAFLRNKGQWLESSPPPRPRPHVETRVLPALCDSPSDDFSWEATHPAPMDPDEPSERSRYSLLIHEVSLLVGLTGDDDQFAPKADFPLVPNGTRQAPDILPLTLTPKSHVSKKHAALPHTAKATSPPSPSSLFSPTPLPMLPSPISRCTNPRPHDEKSLPVISSDEASPVARHKSADVVRPSPRRRHGQVFHVEDSAPRRNAVILDETFIHPRDPPPKPTPNPSANRCSSLDRLETSLLKLEAHAPRHHRKSQSEGRSAGYVALRNDKRPSLPPPRRLKKQQSSHEIAPFGTPRLEVGFHLPGHPPVFSHSECSAPPPLDDAEYSEDHTPGSFMDMDIPQALPKRQASLRQVKSKEKMKSLVSAAKRVSRGVIAWGKGLAGSTKPSVAGQETGARPILRV